MLTHHLQNLTTLWCKNYYPLLQKGKLRHGREIVCSRSPRELIFPRQRDCTPFSALCSTALRSSVSESQRRAGLRGISQTQLPVFLQTHAQVGRERRTRAHSLSGPRGLCPFPSTSDSKTLAPWPVCPHNPISPSWPFPSVPKLLVG